MPVSLMMAGYGPGGRGWAGVMGALLLAGGALLLGRQLGWWTVDLAILGAVALLVLGAGFLYAALARREAWERRREAWSAEARGPEGREDWAAWCGPWAWHGGRRIGLYWMAVMAGFLVLGSYILAARSLGWPSPGWGIAGPYFLLAVGGMFLLRFAAGWRDPERPAPPAP